MEKGKLLLAITPFLLADGLLVLVALLLLRIDSIVNITLYQYDLTFNTNWAIPYWEILRLGLTIIGITMILIPIVGYVSLSHTPLQADKTTVYVCKSCQTSWSKVNKITQVNGKLPTLTIIKACASCDERLLDWTMNKHTTQTTIQKQKPTSGSIPIVSENQ